MQTHETLSDYERERGKPMPSKYHSLTQLNLSVALAQYRPRYIVFSELSLDLDGLRVTPDLCLYRREDVDLSQEEVRMTVPPLLAVEIASPTQGVQELVDKIQSLLERGVRSCWLVQPALQTVTVFAEGQRITFTEDAVTDPATEIEVQVDELFVEA